MSKRKAGEPLGCRDMGESVEDQYLMSRILDTLDCIDAIPDGNTSHALRAVFLGAVDANIRFAMTWSKWAYVPRREP